jgi:stress-induced morphogen
MNTLQMNATEIQTRLQSSLAPSHIEVDDDSHLHAATLARVKAGTSPCA